RSLFRQMLLALALAVLVAQGIGASLLYRAQSERRQAATLGTAAFRLIRGPRPPRLEGAPPLRGGGGGGRPGVRLSANSPQLPGEQRDTDAEDELAAMLRQEGVAFTDVVLVERKLARDAAGRRDLRGPERERGPRGERFGREPPKRVVVAAIRRPDGQWLDARVFVPGGEREFVATLLAQTLLIYLVLVGVIGLLLGRITRPLAALTERVERFSPGRDPDGQLAPTGPDDIRRLILAHNAMEARIAALLDEKDVMLGAIGHDLKTPLAALRVRIEWVEDDGERAKLAAGIEDINRSLDDILSLARVGRPSDPLEPIDLAALVGSVAEEYEDMGEPVELADGERLVLSARVTWLRRALRNLIDNGLRYGERARVAVTREGGFAVIRVEDDGPGIPDDQIARMTEPFTRLESSRNSATGGAGLGLTLARAIAEQHGGELTLENRREGGRVAGLVATLRLPL
ncbi:MAG: ATP-binding protein, partial [Novosphingobium sp.]